MTVRWVKVSSRRGSIDIKAIISDRPIKGMLFMPFHFREAAANVLTSTALDPIAKIPELKICAVKVEEHFRLMKYQIQNS